MLELEIPEKIKEEYIKKCIDKDSRKKREEQRTINIIDIDGCICPSIFDNFTDEKTKDDPETIGELRNKLEKVSLFPEFVNYYRDSMRDTLYNIFITGRKSSHFADITQQQLLIVKKIKNYTIFHFPEHKKHNKKTYYNFKLNKIISLITQIKKKYQDSELFFKIFDDDFSYFENLHLDLLSSSSNEFSFITYLINSNKSWKDINKNAFSFPIYINHLRENQ